MVTINGKPEEVAGISILSYLEKTGYRPETVVVEQNLEIIPRGRLGEIHLADGDKVEILRFVGGG